MKLNRIILFFQILGVKHYGKRVGPILAWQIAFARVRR